MALTRYLHGPPARARRPRSGFTLIELMVTVSILALVATMGVTKYRAALEIARVSKCQRELRVIAQEIDIYRLNHGFRSPPSLEFVGFHDRVDPWGQPYMYLNFEMGTGSAAEFVLSNGLIDPNAVKHWRQLSERERPELDPKKPPRDTDEIEALKRKDRFLFPLNSDYDLFSVGKNGKAWASAAEELSLDDVIRANDGEFYGLASKY